MSDGRHTPGPWTLDDPVNAHVLGDGYHVFSIGRGQLNGFVADADAYLIAAAPDLLAALKALVECLNGDLSPEEAAAWDAARAAIAKAEGGAQ